MARIAEPIKIPPKISVNQCTPEIILPSIVIISAEYSRTLIAFLVFKFFNILAHSIIAVPTTIKVSIVCDEGNEGSKTLLPGKITGL